MKWWDWIAAAVIASVTIGGAFVDGYLSGDGAGAGQYWGAQLPFLVGLYVLFRTIIVHVRQKRRERAGHSMSEERRTVVRKPRGGPPSGGDTMPSAPR